MSAKRQIDILNELLINRYDTPQKKITKEERPPFKVTKTARPVILLSKDYDVRKVTTFLKTINIIKSTTYKFITSFKAYLRRRKAVKAFMSSSNEKNT